jgi:hypothetical protein
VPVPAWKARVVNKALLKEAGINIVESGKSSFCSMYPKQDQLNGKGFGNLIAAPLQGKAGEQGNTLFLDPETDFRDPYPDQWKILQEFDHVQTSDLDKIIKEWDLEKPVSGTSGGLTAKSPTEAVDLALRCDFINWCRDNPSKVPEPLWYAMISNVANIRPGGYSLCHDLSKGYPGYSRQETDAKIHQAWDASGPHTCEHIKKNGFDCKKECGVKSPAGLAYQTNGNLKHGQPMQTIKLSFG